MPNLFNPDTSVFPQATPDEVPSYLLAADNHNIGNQGSSWLDPTTWGDRVGNGLKFGAVSILSGGAQLYNSGVTIGNWFGADIAEASTQDIATSFDSDLGQYYAENQQAADIVGFIATSIIPGMGGIKVLNAGQAVLGRAIATGKIGGNLASATGLLVPKTAMYIDAAVGDINAATATFSAISQNGIKALSSGVMQQTLEAAAFETAVQATMFKSPILDEQSGSDIVKNIITGGLVGGAIGGALEGASIYSKIMKRVKLFESETKFSTARGLQQELNRPDLNVIRTAQDIESAAMPVKPGPLATEQELTQYNTLVNNTEQRLTRSLNDLRTNVNALAKGSDLSATNMTADAMKGMSSDGVMAGILHAEQIVRPGVMTEVEKGISKAVKDGKPVPLDLQVNYIKLTGEGAGTVTSGTPAVMNIADNAALKSGGVLADAVLAQVKDYKFRLGALWDPVSKTGVGSHREAEARYIWADRLEKLPDELITHKNDIPILEKAFDLGKLDLKVVDNTGQVLINKFDSREQLWKYIIGVKEDVANDMIMQGVYKRRGDPELISQSISKIVNTKQSRLDGTLVRDDLKDYRAWQTAKEEYQATKKAKGLPVDEHADDPRYLPSYAKVARRLPEGSFDDATGHVLDGAVWIKSQEKLAQESINNVLAKTTGSLYESIPEITEKQIWQANRGGAGAKFGAFASGSYGSLEQVVNAYGQVTNKLKTQFRQATSDRLQGPLAALGRNQEAAIEFQTVNQKVTRSAKQWVRHEEDGVEYLITTDVKAALEKGADDGATLADVVQGGDNIELKNLETIETVDSLIASSGARTSTYQELRAAQGKTDAKNPSVFRPVRANPKDYPYFAFVKDDKVTGQGHTTMLFADSPAKLQQLGDKAEQAGYRVHYKSDAEEFKKAYGDYEYSRTLNESYIDSDLNNRGIYSEFYTKTDPQKIINDIVQQHLREDDVLAMELMRAKNQKAFDFLEDQGKAYSRVEGSKFGGASISSLEREGKNPYLDYIKTALDISKAPESQLLYSFNKFLDTSVSRAVGAIGDVWKAAKTPYDAEKINSLLDKYGMNTGYRDAAMDLLVNHTAPKGELTKFVRAANGMLAKLTLGLDPLNALVNGIGANVLRGTELTQITRAINEGNSQLAGDLAKLAKIDVTGKGDLIMSPLKLYSQAQKNFFADTSKDLMQRYKDAGYVTGDVERFHSVLDDFALKGTETVSDLNSRTNRAFAKVKELGELGTKLSGNKFMEDYNRFISADVMRQITDLAETHGIMTRQESHAYINTFVNRVDGNVVASQRPLMFQGPLGNAIGLFQSYQFNMMQNLFRYVAEGSKKDVAMLMGLQGTFFGINGLPAFQYINQHVVGTMSGNRNHVDLYDTTYGAAGKQVGDLLMYGLPSDLLRTNLYSRGDINPRSVTIIPTAIKDIPFVSAFSSMLGNLKESFSKMANGADVWSSFLQGVEHNALNRPLAGLAQVLEATGPGGRPYSTTSKGSILFSNDLMSLASLSRLAGGRPLDEAIVNDGVFRIHSYKQYDRDKLNLLGEAVKASSIEGRAPDEDQMIKFAEAYAKSGGKQPQFNQWVLDKMKSANTSEAQKITSQLQNPFAAKVQVLMGGDPYSVGY